MVQIVVAYDNNRAIGSDGQLPWGRSLPHDLQHFKELTVGKTIIMGYHTFASIGRVLPKRQSIILSHQHKDIQNALVVSSLKEAYKKSLHEPFIIGGGQIYAQVLPDVSIIYATEIHAIFPQADTFFPHLDSLEWEETNRERFLANDQNKYDHDFVTYQRKKYLVTRQQ